jgi:hypothetical protein
MLALCTLVSGVASTTSRVSSDDGLTTSLERMLASPADFPVVLFEPQKCAQEEKFSALSTTSSLGNAKEPYIVYPGSYNPVHAGHTSMAKAAARFVKAARGLAGLPAVVFELSVINADKGWISEAELRQRMRQFDTTSFEAPSPSQQQAAPSPPYSVAATTMKLFVDKSHVFKSATFLVGADTAVRVLDPKYYGGVEGMVKDLRTISDNGCTFIVACRVDPAAPGGVLTLANINVPAGVEPGMFSELPEESFRRDISSTQLREDGGPEKGRRGDW